MIITVPYTDIDNVKKEAKFDTDSVMITEENINNQSMVIATKIAKWSFIYAQYRRMLLLLDAEHTKRLAMQKQIVMAATGAKYSSETAKMDAVLTYKQGDAYPYAEEELMYQNKKAELLYYIDIVEGSILKALSMEKDMIVSLGAQMRAGYKATTTTLPNMPESSVLG